MSTRISSGPVLQVLHLDDDPFELERVKEALEKNAIDCTFKVESVSSVSTYKSRLAKTPLPDIVILDIHVDSTSLNGVVLAQETRKISPQTVILMCSTADDITTIADCLNSGADDFISKQSDRGELSLRVYNSYRLAKLKQDIDTDTSVDKTTAKGKPRPVGSTINRVSKRVPLIINSAITAVFIKGESGTGKEVVADLFASMLPNATPFVKINCGAIAPTLLESELFGHVKGAFTGAASDKRGLFEAASEGWIFLDEVATLSPSAQVALLRVLENQEVMRVGSTKPININVRVLSATNEPLEKLVRAGKFRSDLWQRLCESEISLPPLRDRTHEISDLIRHFCDHMPGGPYQVSGPVMEVLCKVSWHQGNVRELRNCLRAMTEMHVNRLLTPLAIPARIWEELGDKPQNNFDHEEFDEPKEFLSSSSSNEMVLRWNPTENPDFDYMADVLLLEMIRKLVATKGKISLRALAQAIGMSRATLSRRLNGVAHRNIIEISELAKMVGSFDR